MIVDIFLYIALGLVGFDHLMKAEAIAAAPLFQSHYKRIAMENQKEIWKDIEEYEGHYQINELGVKSISRYVKCKAEGFRQIKERILKPKINGNGYPCVCLCKGGQKSKTIHRLIAIHFIPNPENKPCINHKNGIKTDFRIINLEWCTHSENHLHAYKTGLKKAHTLGKFGKDNHSSKPVNQYTLSGEFIEKYESQTHASKLTGINQSNISSACRGDRGQAGKFKWKYKDNA